MDPTGCGGGSEIWGTICPLLERLAPVERARRASGPRTMGRQMPGRAGLEGPRGGERERERERNVLGQWGLAIRTHQARAHGRA